MCENTGVCTVTYCCKQLLWFRYLWWHGIYLVYLFIPFLLERMNISDLYQTGIPYNLKNYFSQNKKIQDSRQFQDLTSYKKMFDLAYSI